MEDLSLHMLDIAENSIRAGSRNIDIKIEINSKNDKLTMEICDDGKGMDQKNKEKALDPFFTTKKNRNFGLGLSLLAEAAKTAGGSLVVDSSPERGTKVKANFKASHIDIKPLGDIPQTIVTLIMGHPDVEINYTHEIDLNKYSFRTKEIKLQLNGIPIYHPKVLSLIKNILKEGITSIRRS